MIYGIIHHIPRTKGRLTIFIDRNARNILQVKVNSGSAGGSSTFAVGGGGSVEYNDNVWRHYAFTFKNNPKNNRLGVKSYVNGVLETDKSVALVLEQKLIKLLVPCLDILVL